MVNEELIANITARFQQGEKSQEIREALINEGWSEGDIDAAFAHIRHEGLMQIPAYARIHQWMVSLDHKALQLPTKTLVKIFVAVAVLFSAGVFALYYFLDPMGFRTGERDRQREDATIALRQSLDLYYKDQKAYPAKLSELVPKYLASEPLDPKTNKSYAYRVLDNNANYELCIDFELQSIQCIVPNAISSIPVAVNQPEQPTQPVRFAINGQIFMDNDKDGGKGNDEEGAVGTVVKITNGESNEVCNTTTDSSGIFNCYVPGEGEYSVAFEFPDGYGNPGGNPVIVTLPSASNLPHVGTLFIGLVK